MRFFPLLSIVTVLLSVGICGDTTPPPELIASEMVDKGLLKAYAVETMLNQKLDKLLLGNIPAGYEFRGNVDVIVQKIPVKFIKEQTEIKSVEPEAKQKIQPKKKYLDNGLPVASPSFINADFLINELESERITEEKKAVVYEKQMKALQEPTFEYEISSVLVQVLLDERMGKDQITKIRDTVNTVFSRMFGARLKLDVKSATFPHRIEPPKAALLQTFFVVVAEVLQSRAS